MGTQTVPAPSADPAVWLEWIADHRNLGEAIDTVVDADVHWRLIAWAVGKWEAEHRQDMIAERIAQITCDTYNALAVR